MKLSVIIPTLNEASQIQDAIDSAWRLHPQEVIVVDGQSQDKTADVCSACQCMFIKSARGRGPQLNAGAMAATGDVLLFLHVDCRLSPHANSQIATAMVDNDVQHGGFCQRIDSDSTIYRWIERGNAWRLKHRGVAFGDQGIFMRQSFFEQLGGFPDVPIMEDLILMKQARRFAKPVLLTGPLQVSARRWQKHGVARQTLRNWCLQVAYATGISVERLAQYYAPHSDAKQHASTIQHDS